MDGALSMVKMAKTISFITGPCRVEGVWCQISWSSSQQSRQQKPGSKRCSRRRRINKGERFGKGDTLIADIEIVQEYDENLNAFMNKSYTVIKILEHIERPAQGNLFA